MQITTPMQIPTPPPAPTQAPVPTPMQVPTLLSPPPSSNTNANTNSSDELPLFTILAVFGAGLMLIPAIHAVETDVSLCIWAVVVSITSIWHFVCTVTDSFFIRRSSAFKHFVAWIVYIAILVLS